MSRPMVYVIAGPNGAGKTTFARRLLTHAAGGMNFLNADLLAAGLSPFGPGTMELRAGRLLMERWRELANARTDFAFETTMSGKSYRRLLQNIKAKGYEIRMAYLWLNSVELALRRIRQRVRKGGHTVPAATVRRRHFPGIRNFFQLYLPLADEALLFDASGAVPTMVARFSDNGIEILDQALYEKIQAEGCK